MLNDTEIMAQVLAAFHEEQAEHRQAASEVLLELERNPEHPQRRALLDQLFREVHSLKGGARAAGQSAVEQLAHRMEDLVSEARKGRLQLTPEVCDPLYAALDAVGMLMSRVAAGQPAELEPYLPLIEALNPYAQASGVPAPGPNELPALVALPLNGHSQNGSDPVPTKPAIPESDRLDQEAIDVPMAQTGGATVRIGIAVLDTLLNEAGELTTCSLRSSRQARTLTEFTSRFDRWARTWRRIRPLQARLQGRIPALQPAVHYLGSKDSAHRVAADLARDRDIDALLEALTQANTLISTLEHDLTQYARQTTEDSVRLTTVVDRVQAQVRRARMLPLATIFNQLRLQGREMARAVGKQVVIELDDGGAEVDRQVLERLSEVITHLLRNAIDHGIELPDQRELRGKVLTGHVILKAQVQGDRLTLLIADDGIGLDLTAIKHQALSNGLIAEGELARMSDAEAMRLILLPGLSTRQTVGALSGRGVGLDIVQSHIERMHGHIEVRSAPNQGCSFTISVPLSLARSHGLLVQAGPVTYAIPLEAVRRIIPIANSDIQMIEDHAAIMFDGRPTQVVLLAQILGHATAISGTNRPALLIGSGDRQIACIVDTIVGEQELVVHRLPPPLQELRFVAGATLLIDGSVAPILDTRDLLEAGIGAPQMVTAITQVAEPPQANTILVVDDSITTRTLEKNILEAAGYRVRLATDGMEALQVLDQLSNNGGCALLLSDVDMPRLNGFELTAQLRSGARFKHLPIVLVTSLESTADRERGIAAGADAYIVKRQFEQRVLLDTIAALL